MAIDVADGKVIWKFPIPDISPSRQGGSVGPLFVVNDLVLAAGANGHVYAIDRATGTLRWQAAGSGPYFAGLTVVDQTVIVAGDAGSVEGFDLASGALLWQTPPASSVLNPITLGENAALIPTGMIVAYGASGEVLWQHGGAGFGGPVYNTTPTYHEGILYVGSGAGFHAIRPPER